MSRIKDLTVKVTPHPHPDLSKHTAAVWKGTVVGGGGWGGSGQYIRRSGLKVHIYSSLKLSSEGL